MAEDTCCVVCFNDDPGNDGLARRVLKAAAAAASKMQYVQKWLFLDAFCCLHLFTGGADAIIFQARE